MLTYHSFTYYLPHLLRLSPPPLLVEARIVQLREGHLVPYRLAQAGDGRDERVWLDRHIGIRLRKASNHALGLRVSLNSVVLHMNMNKL